MIWNKLRIGLGFLFLGVGAVGVFLPIWPTTPFVILATGCFSSSPRLKAMMYKNSFFKEHIDNYQDRTGLKRKNVIISLSFLWGMLILSMLSMMKTWSFIVLPAVGVAVTIHILTIAKPKKQKEKAAEALEESYN